MANVDLRPMTLGEVLDRTFTLYRENFLLFAGIAAFPYLVMLIFNFGLLLFASQSAATSGPRLPSSGLVGGVVLGTFGALLLMLVLVGIAQAATVSAVSELFLGRQTTVGESYARAKDKILRVLAIMIMTALAAGVGFLLLIFPGIYLACRLALSVPASVVEQQSPAPSMARSMELSKGHAGQIFLLLLLVTVLTYVVTAILQLPAMVFSVSAALAKQQPSLAVSAYSYVAQFVSQVIVGPVGTISTVLMYYNLRVKKEGFDIQHLMNSLDNVPRPLADPVAPVTR
jgi:Membrane domain of glycerophosphoryl diester phosphodiesterase